MIHFSHKNIYAVRNVLGYILFDWYGTYLIIHFKNIINLLIFFTVEDIILLHLVRKI